MSTPDLRADFTRFERVDTNTESWSPSPMPGVWRKRLERRGPVEAGVVTSVVRYDPGSHFRRHPHPDGEEILVLQGTFTDDRGDHPAGTWMLNPEGFEHTPGSVDGCTLFVKLRQSPGLDREALRVDTTSAAFREGGTPGISTLPLLHQPPHPERVFLLRIAPGVTASSEQLPGGAEIFVIEGVLEDTYGEHPAGVWLRTPPGSDHTPGSRDGCLLYVRTGHMGELLP